MVMACALMVRLAWVPGSLELCQSAHPVSAASSETTAPPSIVHVPAMYSSRATCGWLLCVAIERMSKDAANRYAVTGTSVSGG